MISLSPSVSKDPWANWAFAVMPPFTSSTESAESAERELRTAALENNHQLVTDLLLDRNPGATALIAATRLDPTLNRERNCNYITRLLLLNRADPTQTAGKRGCTALSVAAATGNVGVTKLLLRKMAENQVDSKLQAEHKSAALFVAASFALVHLLLQHRAIPDAVERHQLSDPTASKEEQQRRKQQQERRRLLLHAAARDCYNVAELLLQMRADPNLRPPPPLRSPNATSLTPLLAAAYARTTDDDAKDMVALLLQKRADPKATVQDAKTVLSQASLRDSESLTGDTPDKSMGRRLVRLLDFLLRSEGEEYTDMVESLLQEAG